MGALSGFNSGTGALSSSVWHSHRAIHSSPSAAVQGAELLSTLTPSAAFSLVAGVVAGSHTLTDVISSSGSAAILSSVAPCGDGSSVVVGSSSLSAVGSGMRSVLWGDGGLGTGSGVARSPFGTDGERGSVSRQCPLHKGSEVRSRTIFGRQGSWLEQRGQGTV